MIDALIRKQILFEGKPEPKDVPWFGEPNLGAVFGEEEIEAVNRVIRDSRHWSVGFGPNPKEIEEFETAFADYCGAKHAVAVCNNGVGFDMILKAMDIRPGDEIITPGLNFKAWHMAMIRNGCKVVFCDVDASTFNIDPDDVRKRITEKTRAICPVHLVGIPCPMEELEVLAEDRRIQKNAPIRVIDDAARATGLNYGQGEKVGSKGWATVFSFHSAKLMSTLGEGGMVTTSDPQLAEALRKMRSYGGEDGWGMNFRMSKIQAAVGMVQLKKLDTMNGMRKAVAIRRTRCLSGTEMIDLPDASNHLDHAYYLYPILVKLEWANEKRDRFIDILDKKYGIVCSVPKVLYKRWSYIERKCGRPKLKISEDIGDRIFCPPMHPTLTEKQELYISSAIIETAEKICQR